MIIKDQGVDLTTVIPSDPIEAIVHAIRLAPSGGNMQPWQITISDNSVDVHIDRDKTSLMDTRHLSGSYVAIGVAQFNARIAAAYHGLKATITEFPEGIESDWIFSIEFPDSVSRIDANYGALYRAMLARETNRHIGGEARDLGWRTVDALMQAAGVEGVRLHLISDRQIVERIAHVLGESDRFRYLTYGLNREMFSELVVGPAGDRIDISTLALPVYDLPKLRMMREWEPMQYLLDMSRETGETVGQAFGVNTYERVRDCSAVAVVTVDGTSPDDYLHGGEGLGRIWTEACRHGLGVQPHSPVFLYAQGPEDLEMQSPPFCGDLADLQEQFGQLVGLRPGESPILVMRLSHDVPTPERSRRLSDRYVVMDIRPTAQ